MKTPHFALPFLVCFLVAIHSSSSSAGTYQDIVGVSEENHVVGDTDFFLGSEDFSNVGKIVGLNALGGNTHGCSGTVIGPSSALTAAHCVDVSGLDSIDFTLPSGVTYNSTSWTIHPKWKNNLGRGNDIAVVTFAANEFDGVTQSPLYAGPELGEIGVAVGYGITGTGSTGASGTFGDFLSSPLRAGENEIDQLGSWVKGWSSNILLSDFDELDDEDESHFGLTAPLPFEYLIASGDSGGPLMIGDVLDGYSIAGVASFVASNDGAADSSYGDLSGHTRVSSFASWIDGVINGTTGGDDGGGGGGGPGGGSGGGGGPGNGNGGGPPGGGPPGSGILVAADFQFTSTAMQVVPEPAGSVPVARTRFGPDPSTPKSCANSATVTCRTRR